jgi:molybdate transport system permease protein
VTRSRLRSSQRPPLAIVIPAVIGFAFLLFPLVAMSVRAPWSNLLHLLSQNGALTALRLSLECATAAMLASIVLGVPLAWVLARTSFPGRGLLRALVTLPLVLPPVVAGVALLLAFGRHGLLGGLLDEWFGFTLPFTTQGVIVAETFVAMPFLIVAVEGALRSADLGLEEAAATLGASRLRTFTRVTLPLISPSLAAGSVLAWARALGEFGATITFNGSFPGATQTMPLLVYQTLETDPDEAVALSFVMLAVAVAVLVGLRDNWLHPKPRS